MNVDIVDWYYARRDNGNSCWPRRDDDNQINVSVFQQHEQESERDISKENGRKTRDEKEVMMTTAKIGY